MDFHSFAWALRKKLLLQVLLPVGVVHKPAGSSGRDHVLERSGLAVVDFVVRQNGRTRAASRGAVHEHRLGQRVDSICSSAQLLGIDSIGTGSDREAQVSEATGLYELGLLLHVRLTLLSQVHHTLVPTLHHVVEYSLIDLQHKARIASVRRVQTQKRLLPQSKTRTAPITQKCSPIFLEVSKFYRKAKCTELDTERRPGNQRSLRGPNEESFYAPVQPCYRIEDDRYVYITVLSSFFHLSSPKDQQRMAVRSRGSTGALGSRKRSRVDRRFQANPKTQCKAGHTF